MQLHIGHIDAVFPFFSRDIAQRVTGKGLSSRAAFISHTASKRAACEKGVLK